MFISPTPAWVQAGSGRWFQCATSLTPTAFYKGPARK
nr:MAG TPA: hypothetical protein [Caudoviricetes sp.]